MRTLPLGNSDAAWESHLAGTGRWAMTDRWVHRPGDVRISPGDISRIGPFSSRGCAHSGSPVETRRVTGA
jgi:hypothetical protein